MTLPEHPRIRADLIRRRLDDEHLVYDPVADRTLLLNATAYAVLELADGSRTPEDIATEVCVRFDVTSDVAARDVEATLRELLENGILES